MGEYGIKMLNIEASSLYEYNLGLRKTYKYNKAMLTNSLFLDFLKENGLKTDGNSTRDIICLEFNDDVRSYDDEHKYIRSMMRANREIIRNSEDEFAVEKAKNTRKYLAQRYLELKQNKALYNPISKEDLRTKYYNEGVSITYVTYKKDGTIKDEKTINYKRLFRSTGKAKKGSVNFIREGLYKKALNFLRMGIKIPKKNTPIVEIEAYMPLVASSIVGTVRINPRNILIVEDVKSTFKTDVISIMTTEQKQCYAKEIQDYEVANEMFDGQALIDSSLFPTWGEGYILLRHHFCKMATFNCNIQQFFKDYYGDRYYTAKVKDMFGNEHYVKDIECITTNNAVKFLKFDVSYDYWCNKVFENGCKFGVVKTAHQSKLGDVQRMSYQMVNSLTLDIMPNVVEESIKYITQLKQDNDVFIEYLIKNANFTNDFEALVALVNQDHSFVDSEYFRERKSKIINGYVDSFRRGKIIQDADNLVLVGSPYAMLLHVVGESVENDSTLCPEEGCIQCYTERFDDNEYLACFRSPHNAKHNIAYLHNVRDERIKKYFNFGKQIMALNTRHTSIQDRLNGCDFDSDMAYTTNQPDIVNWAKHCQSNFHTIVNNIPKNKNVYDDTMDDYARVDNELAEAQMAIGTSSNLAQMCLSYSDSLDDKNYNDYVAILSVLAQCAIDNAKRRSDIDINSEITRIKKEIGVKENGFPVFWKKIKGQELSEKAFINYKLTCPMNFLASVKIPSFRGNTPRPMSDYFDSTSIDLNDMRKNKKVEEMIERFSKSVFKFYCHDNVYTTETDNWLCLQDEFDELINTINRMYISRNYKSLMCWLLNRALKITAVAKGKSDVCLSQLHRNRSILFATLYRCNPKLFLECFSKNVKNSDFLH